jgi:nitrate reductase NapE component
MLLTEAPAAIYAAGVVVATVGGWVAAQKLGDQDQPAARLLLWSVIAGVLWPVLLVGMVEMVGVWMLAKTVARPTSARIVGREGWPQAGRKPLPNGWVLHTCDGNEWLAKNRLREDLDEALANAKEHLRRIR